MDNTVKISIIIPIFNASQYLSDCLDSILKQKNINIELVCINDGSTDNSLSILSEYKRVDDRLVIVNKGNEGPAIARNAGTDISRGKYLMFVDSDDIIRDNSLEYIYALMSENNLEFCYFEHKKFVDSDDLLFSHNKNYFLNVVRGIDYIESNISSGYNCDKVWNKAFYIAKKLQAKNGYYFEDQIPTLKGFIEAKVCGVTNYDFYGYRQHLNSVTNSQIGTLHIQSLIMTLDEYLTICLENEICLFVHPNKKIVKMYMLIIKNKNLIVSTESRLILRSINQKIQKIKATYKGSVFDFHSEYGRLSTAIFFLPASLFDFLLYFKLLKKKLWT